MERVSTEKIGVNVIDTITLEKSSFALGKETIVKSFKVALEGRQCNEDERKLKPIVVSRREGGNIMVELDVDDYHMGVKELQHSVALRLVLQKGDDIPINMAHK